MPTLLAHTLGFGAGAPTTATTPAINTTGADLIVAYVVADAAGTGISDSAGNTWTAVTNHPTPNNPNVGRFYYCLSPTTSATHTFSYNANYPVICIQAWSSGGSPAFASEDGTGGFSSTVAPGGGFTATQANSIAITGVAEGTAAATYTINSSFTITDQHALVAGGSYNGAMAYKIIPVGSINPTWTSTVNNSIASAGIMFTGGSSAAQQPMVQIIT